MASGGKLLPMMALSIAGATLLVRHSEQKYYPGLFLWTTLKVFSGIIGLFLTYSVFIYPFFLSPIRHIPGPSGGNFLWGFEPELFKQPRGDTFYQWMETIPNNGIIRFRGFLNTENLISTTPSALADVLNSSCYDYVKPPKLQEFLAKVLGWGVLLVDGQEHKYQRKNLLPAFHIRHIRELTGVFWDKSVELIDAMGKEVSEKNGNVEFGDWASRATLDIIGLAGMGHDFRSIAEPHQDVVEKYSTLLEPTAQKGVYFAMNMLFPIWLIEMLPWKLNRDLKEVVNSLNRLAKSMVLEKKAKLEGGKARTDKDILSVALESGAFSDDQMVDQLLTFLAAGHETTASALTWAIYLLTKHPSMQTRLRQEIRSKLPSPATTSTAPTFEEIDSLPYLHAICSETLRYLPTVPLTSRQSITPTTIQGQHIPVGTRILLVPWGTNKMRNLWGPDADKFNPERWMAEGKANSGGAESNYANMSFLHGPRSCIGQTFAKGEFKCLLAAVVGRFEVEMQRKGQEIAVGGVITTKPVGGMHVRFNAVEGW